MLNRKLLIPRRRVQPTLLYRIRRSITNAVRFVQDYRYFRARGFSVGRAWNAAKVTL